MHKTAHQRYVLDITKRSIRPALLSWQKSCRFQQIPSVDPPTGKSGLAQKNHGGAIALNLSAMNRQGPQHAA